MEYKFKEYVQIMDTPNTRLEEKAIVDKIFSLLNNNKYNSLESFQEENKNLDEFKKNHNLNVVLKHFGEKLTQEDYEKIIQNIKLLTEKKSSFDKEGIKIQNIGDKEFISYNGENKDYYFDNSYNFEDFDKQLEDLQNQNNEFQTPDTKENTELMMEEMEENKKISLILRYLNEINYEVLSEEQKNLFRFAFEYQQNNKGLIRIDLDEKVIVDDENNIMKINKINDEYEIIKSDEKYDLGNKSISENIESNNNLSLMKTSKFNLFSKEE